MLKIKDNVDLKELEKFGFVYHQYNYVYFNGNYLVTVFIASTLPFSAYHFRLP